MRVYPEGGLMLFHKKGTSVSPSNNVGALVEREEHDTFTGF